MAGGITRYVYRVGEQEVRVSELRRRVEAIHAEIEDWIVNTYSGCDRDAYIELRICNRPDYVTETFEVNDD